MRNHHGATAVLVPPGVRPRPRGSCIAGAVRPVAAPWRVDDHDASPNEPAAWHDVGMSFVGVDACGQGWVAVILDDSAPPRGAFVERLDQLGTAVVDARGFAVDIPIGLPVSGRRKADVEAKKLLGSRRNSVFFTPVRAALRAPTHKEGSEISRQLAGQGMSQQAYALAPKIFEAERWLRRSPAPVWEVHPEISFTVLLGHPAAAPKKTWAGTRERHAALRDAGIELEGLGRAGVRAAVDDILDAAVCAWSARRLCRGEGRCLPDPPEQDPETGRPVAIWA